MSAGERVFSVVRGRLYERLPTLALPLGKISCCEADVMPAGTDGQAALFASGFLEREFLEGSMLPERLTLHLLLHLMLGHPQSRMGRDRVLWDTACDLAVLLVHHALLPQEREAPAAFSARCKLQSRRAGRAEATAKTVPQKSCAGACFAPAQDYGSSRPRRPRVRIRWMLFGARK